MKPQKKPSAFTLIELLVVISIIGILAALALPAITSALVKGQMTQTLSNMKQLHLASQQAALDATTTGDATLLGFPGSNSFAAWASNLVPAYLGTNDFCKLVSGAGKITTPGALPGGNTNAVVSYEVLEESAGDMVMLSTGNWTNYVDPATFATSTAKPYGGKGFVVFRRSGDGQVLLPKQSDNTNIIGQVTNVSS